MIPRCHFIRAGEAVLLAASPRFIFILGSKRYRHTCATIIGPLVGLLETVRQADSIPTGDRSHSGRTTLKHGHLFFGMNASRYLEEFKKEWKEGRSGKEDFWGFLYELLEPKSRRGSWLRSQPMLLSILILYGEAIHVYVPYFILCSICGALRGDHWARTSM